MRRYAFEPIELQPGLVLRLLTREEMWPLVAIVRDTGLHGDNQAAVQQRVYGWWDDPACWPLGVFWRGEVKQYECYHIRPTGMDGDVPVRADRPRLALAGFMTHVDRGRPHWFYRECARVTFERLFALGVRRLVAFPRADRPDWISRLKTTYGAREVRPGRVSGQTVPIEYDLATAIAGCTGWPERLSAGPEWAWERGILRVTEGTEADLPALRDIIPRLFRFLAGKDEALRILDRCWHLDRGTVLIGRVRGEIAFIRLVRRRRPGVANFSVLSPFSFTPASKAFLVACAVWARACGLEQVTTFIPAKDIATPVYQKLLQLGHLTPVTLHDEFAEPAWECIGNLDQVLAADWETKP